MSDDLAAGWSTVKLQDLLLPGGIFDGPFGSNLKSADYREAGVRVIRLENLANLRFVSDKCTFISPEKYEALKRHTVGEGDIMFGSFVDGAVRVCLLPKLPGPAIAKADCFCIRSNDAVVNRRFLALQLGSSRTREALLEQIHGATRPRVTTKQLRDLGLLLPPMAEQCRIVAQVESAIGGVRAARERLDRIGPIVARFRQAVLASACSGRLTEGWRAHHPNIDSALFIKTLGAESPPLDDISTRSIPDEWAWATTESLCEAERPITYGVIKLGAPVEGGVPTLRSSDVRPLFINQSGVKTIDRSIADQYRRTYLRGGEVLVTVRGTLGGVAVVPPGMAGFNISREVAQLPLKPGINPAYVMYAIASISSQNWLREQAKGVAYTGINIEDLRRLPLPLPSPEEQAEIVRRVSALLDRAAAIEQHVAQATAHTDLMIQAVLAKAFSGELVPTEAELAHAEGRDYEPAEKLLKEALYSTPRVGSSAEVAAPKGRQRRSARRASSAES